MTPDKEQTMGGEWTDEERGDAEQALKGAADRVLRGMPDDVLAEHLEWQADDTQRIENYPAPIHEAARRLRSTPDDGPLRCRICGRPDQPMTICEYCDRMMESLDPDEGSEGREPVCEKCGSDEVGTRYLKATKYLTLDRGSPPPCKNPDEHLHRRCRNCGYDWCGPLYTTEEEGDG